MSRGRRKRGRLDGNAGRVEVEGVTAMGRCMKVQRQLRQSGCLHTTTEQLRQANKLNGSGLQLLRSSAAAPSTDYHAGEVPPDWHNFPVSHGSTNPSFVTREVVSP